jgi:excisionase family DNA binding protein
MKVRNVQFGVRKNPGSSRVHGLRLAVSSLPVESVAEPQSRNGTELAPPLTPQETCRDASSLNTLLNEATGEKGQERGQLLTVEDVARLLHVPVSWVYGRTRRRSLERLPGYRLGKYWRFRKEDITAWLESQNPRAGSL